MGVMTTCWWRRDMSPKNANAKLFCWVNGETVAFLRWTRLETIGNKCHGKVATFSTNVGQAGVDCTKCFFVVEAEKKMHPKKTSQKKEKKQKKKKRGAQLIAVKKWKNSIVLFGSICCPEDLRCKKMPTLKMKRQVVQLDGDQNVMERILTCWPGRPLGSRFCEIFAMFHYRCREDEWIHKSIASTPHSGCQSPPGLLHF